MIDKQQTSLPNRRYFTISEVSQLCQVKDHVLRYWERVIPTLAPERRKGRRYYQRQDVMLVRQIRSLLEEEGYTIEGVRLRLQGEGRSDENSPQRQTIRQAVAELQTVMDLLRE